MPARPRLSDAETQRRVLDAAVTLLDERGVTLGLAGLPFEDVVRASGVSRTSAYRRWPSRDRFVDDVLVQVARGIEPPETPAQVLVATARRWQDRLGTVDGRHDLLVELTRVAVQTDLDAAVTSRRLHAELAVRAAVGASDGLHARVADALAAARSRAVARDATLVAGLATVLALRPAAPLVAPDAYRVVADGLAAGRTGFALQALTEPALLAPTRHLAAHGSAQSADWSVASLTLTGVVVGALEPDPDAIPAAAPRVPVLLRGVLAAADRAARPSR